MRTLRSAGVVVIALATLVPGCGDDSGNGGGGGGGDDVVQVLTGRVTEVDVGDTLELRLSAEPGLGDAWQVAVPPDEAVLRVVDERSESDEPELAGGLWTQIFVMEAVGPGRTEVVVHNCFRCDDAGNTPPEYAEEAVDLTYEVLVR